jgi:hypothetical protein
VPDLLQNKLRLGIGIGQICQLSLDISHGLVGLRLEKMFMRMFLLVIVAMLGLIEPFTHPASGNWQVVTSLCTRDEQILFSCKVSDASKLISLCGSRQLTKTKGYIQYRFGKAGAPELQFPQKLENTQTAFRYSHYFRYQVDRTQITFENNGYTYALYDDYEGDMRPVIKATGVRVTPPGNERGEVDIKCRGNATSHLAALSSVVLSDENNEPEL